VYHVPSCYNQDHHYIVYVCYEFWRSLQQHKIMIFILVKVLLLRILLNSCLNVKANVSMQFPREHIFMHDFKYQLIMIYFDNVISNFKVPDTILTLYYWLKLGPMLPDIDDIDTKNHWPITIPRFSTMILWDYLELKIKPWTNLALFITIPYWNIACINFT